MIAVFSSSGISLACYIVSCRMSILSVLKTNFEGEIALYTYTHTHTYIYTEREKDIDR